MLQESYFIQLPSSDNVYVQNVPWPLTESWRKSHNKRKSKTTLAIASEYRAHTFLDTPTTS